MNFPHYYQLDTMDCGATCLRMIAKYYRKEYNLEYLREKCYTSKDGVSLLSVADTAEELGFKTIAGKLNIETLIKQASLPCILYWNQEHLIVLYKIKRTKQHKKTVFYVADPGKGLLKYKEDVFLSNWLSTKSEGQEKGVVLLLEPTQAFYKQENDKTNTKSLKFLFSYFLKYKKFFGQLVIGLLLGSLFQLIFPVLTQSIVDTGIVNKNVSFIYLILMAQMVLIISRMSVEFIRRWILLHISTRINISLISDFFIKLMKLPMSYFDTKLTGDILQRINDHERIESFLTSRTLDIIFSFFTLVIFGIVLWIYSFKIFLIFFIGSLLYTAWIFIFLKKRRELDFKYFEVRATNQNKTYQLIQGMQEIKLQNSEKQKRWEWEDIQADLFKVNISALKLEQTQEAGNIFINESNINRQMIEKQNYLLFFNRRYP